MQSNVNRVVGISLLLEIVSSGTFVASLHLDVNALLNTKTNFNNVLQYNLHTRCDVSSNNKCNDLLIHFSSQTIFNNHIVILSYTTHWIVWAYLTWYIIIYEFNKHKIYCLCRFYRLISGWLHLCPQMIWCDRDAMAISIDPRQFPFCRQQTKMESIRCMLKNIYPIYLVMTISSKISIERCTFCPVDALVSTYGKLYFPARVRALTSLITRWRSKSLLLPIRTISGSSQYACVYKLFPFF